MPLANWFFLLLTLILDIKNVACSHSACDLVRESVTATVEGYCFLPVNQYGDFNNQKGAKKETGQSSLSVVSTSQRSHLFGLCSTEEHQAHASSSSFIRSFLYQEDQQRNGDSIYGSMAMHRVQAAQEAHGYALHYMQHAMASSFGSDICPWNEEPQETIARAGNLPQHVARPIVAMESRRRALWREISKAEESRSKRQKPSSGTSRTSSADAYATRASDGWCSHGTHGTTDGTTNGADDELGHATGSAVPSTASSTGCTMANHSCTCHTVSTTDADGLCGGPKFCDAGNAKNASNAESICRCCRCRPHDRAQAGCCRTNSHYIFRKW